MDNILIENYRGWEIFFDKNSEDFYAKVSDNEQRKRSYASAKKYIDDYIKENNTFKPVIVQKLSTIFGEDIIELIGMRKDGKFIYKGRDNKKYALSDYYEKDYFIVDSRNDIHIAKIKELKGKIQNLNNEIIETSKKLIRFTVKQLRENLKGEK